MELATVSESPITNSYAAQGTVGVYAGSYISLSGPQEGQGGRVIYNTAQDLGTSFTIRISYSSGSCYYYTDGGADGYDVIRVKLQY